MKNELRNGFRHSEQNHQGRGLASLAILNLLAVVFIFLCNTQKTQASELREFYNGIRGLSMGDTTVAIANDETALLLNPAGLGKLRDYYGTILDPELEFSKNVQDIYQAKAMTQPFDLPSVAPSILASPNTYYHARGQLFPSFVAKNFGIGILARRNLDGEISSTDLTKLTAFYRDDLALLLGYNFRFWAGRIKIGFTAKAISRIEVNSTTLDPTSDLSLNNLATSGVAKEGVGVGGDAGLILTAPWDYLPSIAAVVRDVGGTKFDYAYNSRLTTTTRPDPQLQDMDVGVSLSPIWANRTRSIFSFEYRNILTASSIDDPQKQYHFGAEVNFSDIVFLRAGYNQRYWTAGLELASENMQIQVGSYGEEIGTSGSPREDRRYAAKFSFRF